jgi:hypothetical protein
MGFGGRGLAATRKADRPITSSCGWTGLTLGFANIGAAQ